MKPRTATAGLVAQEVMGDMANRILVGDALTTLKQLPSACADLVITSPPYFQQRRYTDLPDEIGTEQSVDEYLQRILAVFDECLRITKPRGSVVFNVGDKYVDSNLMLIPWRFALAARQRATLINNVTWVKKNPTPRQFNRRLVSATEPFFHYVKQKDYRYDLATTTTTPRKANRGNGKNVGQKYFPVIDQSALTAEEKSAAYAALQAVITEVQAGTLFDFRMKIRGVHAPAFGGQPGGRNTQIQKNGFTIIRFRGGRLNPDYLFAAVENIRGCAHPAIYPSELVEHFIRLTTAPGDLVVDPFIGSGTTAVAAQGLGRRWLGCELSPELAAAARQRIATAAMQKRIVAPTESPTNRSAAP